jgi:hypothetical protein
MHKFPVRIQNFLQWKKVVDMEENKDEAQIPIETPISNEAV